MKLNISSDDINLLVYRYLLENGYCHTAFSFNKEANIANNPYYSNHADKIPPNALVSFMQKAMIYIYLEYHTDDITGDQILCDEPFSFFRKHNCFKKIGQTHGLPLSQSISLSRDRSTSESIGEVIGANDNNSSSVSFAEDSIQNGLHLNVTGKDCTKSAVCLSPEDIIKGSKGNMANNNPIFVGPPQRRLGDKWQLCGYLKLLEYVAPNLDTVCIFNPVIPGYVLKKIENGPPSLYKVHFNSKSSICETISPIFKFKSRDNSDGIGTCIKWRGDGKFICTGHSDGTVNIWTIDGIKSFSVNLDNVVISDVAFSGNKFYWESESGSFESYNLAIGSMIGDVYVYKIDVDKHSLVGKYKHPTAVTDILWRNNTIVISASIGGAVTIFDVRNGIYNTLQFSVVNNIPFVGCDSTGLYLAAVDDSSILKIYKFQDNVIEGEFLNLKGHNAQIISASWYSGSVDTPVYRICSIGMDKQFIIWDVFTECPIMTLLLDQIPTTISINPNDTFVALGSYGNSLKIYSLQGLTLSCSLYDQTVATNISWSSDSNYIVYNVYNLQRSLLIPINALSSYQSE